jgi:hypothetical protein
MAFSENDTAYRRVFRLACILLDRLPLDTVFQMFADAEWQERMGCPRHEFKVARILEDGEALYGMADKMTDMLMNEPERMQEWAAQARERQLAEEKAFLAEQERKMNDG